MLGVEELLAELGVLLISHVDCVDIVLVLVTEIIQCMLQVLNIIRCLRLHL